MNIFRGVYHIWLLSHGSGQENLNCSVLTMWILQESNFIEPEH